MKVIHQDELSLTTKLLYFTEAPKKQGWLVVSTQLKNISQILAFPQFSGWTWKMFETTT